MAYGRVDEGANSLCMLADQMLEVFSCLALISNSLRLNYAGGHVQWCKLVGHWDDHNTAIYQFVHEDCNLTYQDAVSQHVAHQALPCPINRQSR
jgi:hypothetical protein